MYIYIYISFAYVSYPTRETVPLMEFINKFLNSISAMLPLPSATLPLPLFTILPLWQFRHKLLFLKKIKVLEAYERKVSGLGSLDKFW